VKPPGPPASIGLEVSARRGRKISLQDPGDLETLDAVRFHVGHDVSPVLAALSELEEALQRHYESGKSDGRSAGREINP
jgi:hypothetical protein